MLVTIGVPAYRRFDSLVKLIRQIKASEVIRKNCKVLVINDSGAAYNNQQYRDFFKAETCVDDSFDCRYIENANNIGYPKTLIRLFEECDTEFLLMMADDDLMIDEYFDEVLELLTNIKPDIASTQWLRNGMLYRGKTRLIKVQSLEYQECCGHAPGVIYNVAKVVEVLDLLRKRLEMMCAAGMTYPQVLLCIALLIKNDNCWFFPYPLAEEGDALPSGINDGFGHHYSSVSSRIQQFAAYDNYISCFSDSDVKKIILNQSRITGIRRILGSDSAMRRTIFVGFIKERLNIRYFVSALFRLLK